MFSSFLHPSLGYIYATGVAEIWVGVAMALSGLMGVFGTFVFTWLHKRNGLERTGLVAFNLEILCLSLCVASVWVPGSPFDPYYKLPPPGLTPLKPKTNKNCSSDIMRKNFEIQNRTRRSVELEELYLNCHQVELNLHIFESHDVLEEMMSLGIITDDERSRFRRATEGESFQYQGTTGNETTKTQETDLNETEAVLNLIPDDCKPKVYSGLNLSAILLIIGIITSRTGLWMADLTITQLQQENVAEKERGIVNGVQNSLNMFMDMLKFALVIVIPYVETYGYLVMLSFMFICTGGVLFAYHSWTVRGHLFHFDKICGGAYCAKSNGMAANGHSGGIMLAERPRDSSEAARV